MVLKFSLSLRDLSGEWSHDGIRWSSGQSWIEPFAHSQVESLAVTDGTSWALTVRERCSATADGSASAVVLDGDVSSVLEEWRSWPLGAVVLHVRHGRLTLSAGACGGVAPVHLVSSGSRLHGSWDMRDLRRHVSGDRLVGREVARMLTGHARYGHETLFEGVRLLTVGSVAAFSPIGLVLRYPAPVGRDQPRELAAAADPVTAFEELLAWVLKQRPVSARRAALQLSGGQDSATVGLSLGAVFPDAVRSCAMELPGAAGAQQMARRAVLAEACRLAGDVTVGALDFLPVHPAGVRRVGWCSPYDEPYAELLEGLLARLTARGVETVFTGFGGDELMAVGGGSETVRARPWLGPVVRELETERDAGIAPPTLVPATALLALRTVSAPMLRAGVWPVAPLADPHVVRFARWLPHEWRADKRLMRERLVRRGLPGHVVRPALRENFREVMAAALHRHAPALLREMAAGSPLVEGGFLDRDALLAVADECERGVREAAEHCAVYAPISMHLALRSAA
ncbi:asparagine synthase-related protein [Streptomyces sp. NPDC006458]|uniref:asparagine synthase-related protein n=1 Tax=Streptomyces sp. NPDC006458 TaxID=3154302 RepID=UPI0033A4121D